MIYNKKIVSMLLCAALLASTGLTGCGKAQQPNQPTEQQEQKSTEDGTAIANPMIEHKSLDEINEITGGKMVHPAVMGVTDEHFITIDNEKYVIAEYDFELNGHLYTFRNAVTKEDISGLHVDGKTAFANAGEELTIICSSEWNAARWFVDDHQYVLNCTTGHNPMDEETFKGIVNEMASMTQND